MAIGYGLSYYGNGADFYGNPSASTATGAVQWIFLVDWDGDSTFAYNEAAYLIDLETSRGERYFVRERGDGFEVMRPGEGSATLTDQNGRFDPDNTGGPLYEKILPGRKFRLSVKDLGTGAVYPVMAGFINDIPPITERDTIELKLRESWSLLDNEVSIPILYRNSISQAMGQLLDAAEWPNTFGRSLDTETQQITAFSVDKINALDTIIELGEACLGQVFADNEGRLIFHARGQASMPTVAIDQSQVDKAIRRSQPWENLRNIIHVTANKKVKAREAPIWQNSGVIQVNGSSSNVIWVQYDEAIDVRVYEFTANASVNGTGADLTSSVTYDLDIFPSSLKITFTNASASTAYITRMVVLGRPILDQPIRKTVQNALSTATYGKMIFSLDNPWLQDLTHATEYATYISNFLDEPQRTIEVQIEQRPELQYTFDLMDKIDFTSAKLGIDATYYAGLIEHRWLKDNGQAVKTTLVMRPRLTDGTAISNDPEDPDLPYIPAPPYNPGGWPIDIPTTPPGIPAPGGTCMTDPASPANGPFVLGGPFPMELRSNGTYYKDIGIAGGVFIRPSSFTNKSAIGITGDWQRFDWTTQTWVGDTSSTNWRVIVNGTEATKRTITDAGSGERILDITSGGGQQLNNIRVEIDQGGGAVGERYLMGAVGIGYAPTNNRVYLDSNIVGTSEWQATTKLAGIARWYSERLGNGPIKTRLDYLLSDDIRVDNTVSVNYYNPSGGFVQFTLNQHGDDRYRTWRIFYNPVPGQPLEPLDIDNVSISFIEEGVFTADPWIETSTFSAFDVGTDTYRWVIRSVALYNVCGG